MSGKTKILPAQAPSPSPALPATAPTKSGETIHDLIEEGTPTLWPTLYSLSPQNNKKEIVQTECAIENKTEAKGKREAVFVCPFGATRIGVQARKTMDSATGDWSPWGYLARGKNFSNRSLMDKGVALYFDGQTLEAHPYENNLEIEEPVARVLAPEYPLPKSAELRELEIAEERKKIILTRCEAEPDFTVIRKNVLGKIELSGAAKNFTCPSKHPSLINPLRKNESGNATIYSLGEWAWSLPTPGGQEKTLPAREGRSIALFPNWAKEPVSFSQEEELLESLTEVFPKPPAIQGDDAPPGESCRRVFSPSACRSGTITTDHNNRRQKVDWACSLSSGGDLKVTLTRDYRVDRQGASIIFTVKGWKYAVQTQTGNQQTGRVEKDILTVGQDQGEPFLLQHNTDVERERLLQKRYEACLEGKYRPASLIIKGGAGFLRGHHFGNLTPDAGMLGSRGGMGMQGDAVDPSRQNSFDNMAKGLFGNLSLELYPLGILGESIGGPFLLGSLEGGYAGNYLGNDVRLLEAEAGVGVSLRELAGWNNPFDLSFHYFLFRKPWTNRAEILSDKPEWFPLEAGACLEYGRFNACLGYSHNEVPDQDLNLVKFLLGWELLKGHRHHVVEVAE